MQTAGDPTKGDDGKEKGRRGVLVRPLEPSEREEGQQGVVVERATGAAARAGIQPGDKILSFNGKSVKNAEQLQELVQQAGRKAAVLVERHDAHIFIPVELG